MSPEPSALDAPPPPPPRRALLYGALATLLALAAIFRTHLALTRPEPAVLNPYDEGYLSAFAWRMLEGQWLPYVDAVSHRGPLLYWVTAAATWVFGTGSFYPLRWLATASISLSVVLTFVIAARAGRALGGAVAALGLTISYLLVLPLKDGLAFNAEHLLNLGSLGAVACAWQAVTHGRRRWLFAAGLASALGALSKQVGLVNVLPVLAWLLADGPHRRDPQRRALLRDLGAYAAGLALPVALVVLRYAWAQHPSTLGYYLITYNRAVYMAPLQGSVGYLAAVRLLLARTEWWALLLLALGAGGLWLAHALRRRGFSATVRAFGLELTVALSALTSLVAAWAPLRDFAHYYLQALPWLLLGGGLLLERWLRPVVRQGWLGVGFLALTLPLALLLHLGWSLRLEDARKSRDFVTRLAPSHNKACRWLEAHTQPRDTLFVWGFDPSLYTACQRRPATRFVYTTLPAGYVPWFEQTQEEEERLVVPGSREQLLADLEANPPAAIIDSGATMNGRSLARYAFLQPWLHANYCPRPREFSYGLYTRRPAGGTCPAE